MGQGDYLVVAWRAGDPDAEQAAALTARRLDADADWTRHPAPAGLMTWTRGHLPIRALPEQRGLVIGDLFEAPGGLGSESPFSPGFRAFREGQAVATGLSRAHWGRYVAVLRAPLSGVASVFRDPGGQLCALTWETPDGLTAIASDLGRAPGWLRPRRLSLDWMRIARFVAMPAAASTDPLFAGVEAVGPGEMIEVAVGAIRRTAIWTPAAFAANDPPHPSEVVARLDVCVEALLRPHTRIIAEVSGGLDSAVVAGALQATGQAEKVAAWINRVGGRAEGDERAFAQAVVERLGASLTEIVKPMTPICEEDLAEVARGTWPGMDGVDAAGDRDDAARLAANGAAALVSGHGGDGVFFQMPSAMILADAIRDHGWRALFTPLPAAVARRTHQSVWGVLAAVRRERQGKTAPALPFSGFVSREVAEVHRDAIHSWVSDALAKDVAPGKRQQIRALANAHLYNGESRRRRAGHVIFPLLAQPVVELGLAIPTYDLAGGPWDRPYQRATFAARIPDCIRQRRLKGDLTAYWSQLIAASLPTLRPFLLDGCLCSAGVLDRVAMEAALDPAALIRAPYTREVLWAASTEAWIRHWQARVPDAAGAGRGLQGASRR